MNKRNLNKLSKSSRKSAAQKSLLYLVWVACKTGLIVKRIDKLVTMINIEGVKKGVKKIVHKPQPLDSKGFKAGWWWPQLDSNQRPIDYESSALTN